MKRLKNIFNKYCFFIGQKSTSEQIKRTNELTDEAVFNISELERITMNGEDKWMITLSKERNQENVV